MIETERIEKYIYRQSNVSDYLLMEAQIQVDDELSERVAFQKQTYQVIREYGRQQLRAEICQVQKKVFSDSAYRKFRAKVRSYFRI